MRSVDVSPSRAGMFSAQSKARFLRSRISISGHTAQTVSSAAATCGVECEVPILPTTPSSARQGANRHKGSATPQMELPTVSDATAGARFVPLALIAAYGNPKRNVPVLHGAHKRRKIQQTGTLARVVAGTLHAQYSLTLIVAIVPPVQQSPTHTLKNGPLPGSGKGSST